MVCSMPRLFPLISSCLNALQPWMFDGLQEDAGTSESLEIFPEPTEQDSSVTCNGCQLSLLTVWPRKIDNVWHGTGSNLPQLQPPLFRPASHSHTLSLPPCIFFHIRPPLEEASGTGEAIKNHRFHLMPPGGCKK